jgi:hypothetical protein
MAYPATADLVSASSVAALAELSTEQQDALRAEAILAIEGHCNQSFLPEGTDEDPVAKTIDSPGGRVLYLPKRLSSLSELAISDSAITTSDVALDDDHGRLNVIDHRSGGSWLTRAEAQMEWPDLTFPQGSGTAAVSGIWGWADEEYIAELSAITTALRYDMEDRALANAHALSESVRSAKALGLSGVSQGNLSLQLDGREAALSVRVQRLLTDLVWENAGGVLA